MFEAMNWGTKEVCVIKDCRVEDHPGKQMEHVIVVGIKNNMDGEKFCRYFVDVYGHRKT